MVENTEHRKSHQFTLHSCLQLLVQHNKPTISLKKVIATKATVINVCPAGIIIHYAQEAIELIQFIISGNVINSALC